MLYLFSDRKSTDPSDPDLVKMLNSIDLLSVCAEGGKRRAEEVGQSFFTLQEIIT